MVAAAESLTHHGVSTRLLRWMREVELPGEASDHVWMGRRIEEAVEQISERIPREMGQKLVMSGGGAGGVLFSRGVGAVGSGPAAVRVSPRRVAAGGVRFIAAGRGGL